MCWVSSRQWLFNDASFFSALRLNLFNFKLGPDVISSQLVYALEKIYLLDIVIHLSLGDLFNFKSLHKN